jgi:hypothetical protein
MKRIVMLTCPKAENVCTGGGCFSALNSRTKAFAPLRGRRGGSPGFYEMQRLRPLPREG